MIECLKTAAAKAHKSVAFPAIGTGHLGFTQQEAACIMSEAVVQFAKTFTGKMEIYFVIFPSDSGTFQVRFFLKICLDFKILQDLIFFFFLIIFFSLWSVSYKQKVTIAFQAFEDKLRRLQQKASHSSFTPGNNRIFQFIRHFFRASAADRKLHHLTFT